MSLSVSWQTTLMAVVITAAVVYFLCRRDAHSPNDPQLPPGLTSSRDGTPRSSFSRKVSWANEEEGYPESQQSQPNPAAFARYPGNAPVAMPAAPSRYTGPSGTGPPGPSPPSRAPASPAAPSDPYFTPLD